MWPWQKSKEEMVEFKNAFAIGSDFIPLGYITNDKKRKVEIVGTDHLRKSLSILSKSADEYSIRHILSTKNISIDYIVPVDIVKNGYQEYVILSKTQNNKYSIYRINSQGYSVELGSSDSMPFLISHNNLVPALFVQNHGNTYFLDILDGQKHLIKTNFGILRDNHSSGFVDVNGDGISDLVLDTLRNGNRMIEVWENIEGNYFLLNSLKISINAGPIVFGDFTGTGSIDILYLSNNTPAINIIPNKRLPYCTNQITSKCLFKSDIMVPFEVYGYMAEDTISYKMEEIEEFYLSNKNGPVFPNVLDINSNTYPDIVAIAKYKNEDKFQPKLFLNKNGAGFTNQIVFNSLPEETSLVSFYRENKDKWNVIASTMYKSKSTLFLYENNSDISGYHLNIYTKIDKNKQIDSIPAVGANYSCRITETGRVIVGMFPAQSGYVSMQSPITTLGLGSTNVFISSLHSRVPNKKYHIGLVKDKIIPNSELLIGITCKNHIKYSLYLNVNAYWPIAMPIILIIMLILIVITGYFSIKKKSNKIRIRRTRYDVTFGAL